MRKKLIWIFLAIILLQTACTNRQNPFLRDTQSVAESDGTEDALSSLTHVTSETDASMDSNAVTVSEQILFAKYGIKMTLTSMKVIDYAALFYVTVENTTDVVVEIFSSKYEVNDFTMSFSSFLTTVPANTSQKDTILIRGDDLQLNCIKTIRTLEIDFTVYDGLSREVLFETVPVVVRTSAADLGGADEDLPTTLIFQNEVVNVYLWGSSLIPNHSWSVVLYVENISEKYIGITCTEVYVNGDSIDGLLSPILDPGKREYTRLAFMFTDLEDINLDLASIHSIDFGFVVMELGSFDDLGRSDIISLEVNSEGAVGLKK